MGICDFIIWPSLDGTELKEEPHDQDTSILQRVVDPTTPPAPEGTAIPEPKLEEIIATRDDLGLVAKAKNAAKRKASTRPEVSTDATKKKKVAKKNSGVGSSEQPASDGGGQVDDTHDTRRLTEVNTQDHATDGDEREKELLPLRPGPYYMPYPYGEGTSDPPLKYTKEEWDGVHAVNLGLLNKEIFKDPKVCKTVIDRVPTPAERLRVAKLSPKELSDRMSVLTCLMLSHVGELNTRYTNLVEQSDRLSEPCRKQTRILKPQNNDHREQTRIAVRANMEVARLTSELNTLKAKHVEVSKLCHSQGRKIEKHKTERDAFVAEKTRFENELTKARRASTRANDELVKARSEAELQKADLKELKHKLSEQESETHKCKDIIAGHERDIKKIRSSVTSFLHDDFEKLVRRFLGSGEFNQALASVLSLAVSTGVELGLQMGRSETQFQEISQRVSNFVPGAKKKCEDAVAAFPTRVFPFFNKVSQNAANTLEDIAKLEPDKIIPPRKEPSTTVTSSGGSDTRTLDRSSTPSTETFGHTTTSESGASSAV